MQRFAQEQRVLPSYIYRWVDESLYNFQRDLSTFGGPTFDPIEYYLAINERALQPLNLTLDEIILPMIFFNEKFIRLMRQDPEYSLLQAIPNAEHRHEVGIRWGYFYDPQGNLLPQGREWIAQMEQAVAQFLREAQAAAAPAPIAVPEPEAGESAFPRPRAEPIIEEKSLYIFETSYNYPSLNPLFDRVRLSPDSFLYAATRVFYKVLESYLGPIVPPEDTQTLFLETRRGRIVVELDQFVLTFSTADPDLVLEMAAELGLSNAELSIDQRFNFSFFIPHQRFEAAVLADLLFQMPNQSFFLDETSLKNRFKNAISIKYRLDPELVLNLLFTPTKAGLRVRIPRARDKTDAVRIQRDVLKLFELYNARGAQVARAYQDFFQRVGSGDRLEFLPPDRAKTVSDYYESDLPLTKIIDDMFPPSFTRKCGNLPYLVSAEQKVQHEAEGFKVLEFPERGEPRYLFSCKKWAAEGYIYPGMRENPLSNRDKYPELPCCYKTDHSVRRVVKTHYGKSIIQTNKFVFPEKLGKLPAALDTFARQFTSNPVYRMGVNRGKYSLLEAILFGLNVNDFRALDLRARVQRVLEARANLGELEVREWWNPVPFDEIKGEEAPLISTAHQELWDFSVDQVQHWLEDIDEWMNPVYWYSLLESIFHCRLVLFDMQGFVQPRFKDTFLRDARARDEPILLLYINPGSESDEAKYPQIELIQGLDEQLVYDFYVQSLQNFAGAQPLIPAPPLPRGPIHSQFFNTSGKVVGLNLFGENGSVFSLLLDTPRAPMAVPVAAEPEFSEPPAREVGAPWFGTTIVRRESSALDEFRRARRAAQELVVEAIRVRARGGNIKVKAKPSLTSTSLTVPTKTIRRRLNYAVDLFRRRFPLAFENYDEFGPSVKSYENASDFQPQAGVIVANTNNLIHQDRDVDSFFIRLGDQVWFCKLEARLESPRFFLFLPAQRQVLQVGEPDETSIRYVMRGDRFYRAFPSATAAAS